MNSCSVNNTINYKLWCKHHKVFQYFNAIITAMFTKMFIKIFKMDENIANFIKGLITFFIILNYLLRNRIT